MEKTWVIENQKDDYSQGYRVSNTVTTKKSEYQELNIIENPTFGKIMFLDGNAMLSEKDEFIYHEMISHVPINMHPNPKNILIIGGGDGGTALECLRHREVESVDMIEIDKLVCDESRKHFPKFMSAFEDKRLNIRYEDGIAFVKNAPEKIYDIVIVDSTDPFGSAEGLFRKEFYADVYRVLKDDGITVVQAESAFFDMPLLKNIGGSFRQIYPKCFAYQYHMVVYPGALWMFFMGSKRYHPINDFEINRFESFKNELKYYTEDIHKAAFALPKFVKDSLIELIDN
ncbi:polyamine aminopropyltransferase [bacterium]|nr:polyamine aminopropyltransferase [bacterium]